MNEIQLNRLGCVECSYPSYKSDPLNSFENSICCPNQFKSPNHPRTMFVLSLLFN